MGELGSFGAIISHAIKLEESSAGHYREILDSVSEEGLKDFLGNIISENEKNGKKLGRLRQKYINEMILEPITGFRSEDYEVNGIAVDGQAGKDDVINKIIDVEETVIKFYKDAADKLSYINPDASRNFEKMSDIRIERKSELKEQMG